MACSLNHWTLPMSERGSEPDVIHTFKNHLAIVIGFSDLLLSEMAADDQRRKDVMEINKAGHAALALLTSLMRELP